MSDNLSLQANIGMNSQKLVISTGEALPDVESSELKPIDWSTSKNTIGRSLTTPVVNHGQCGNCWAMTTTSVLADRLIVQSALSGKKVGSGTINLQPALTTQCVEQTLDRGCNGGSVYYAGKYFETTGASQITGAQPTWSSLCDSQCTDLPKCKELRQKFASSSVYKAKDGTTTSLSASNIDGSVDVDTTITNIKKALLGGPVIGQMFCANDLIHDFYTSEIWTDKTYGTNGIYINGKYNTGLDVKYPNSKMGDKWADIQVDSVGNPSAHAVEVVGWDVDGKYGPYWIIKNNWGSRWNGNGYFNYAMYPKNKLIALDIPVPNAVSASTGKVIKNFRPDIAKNVTDLFGGCLYFEPDGILDTNDPDYLTYKNNKPVITAIAPSPPETPIIQYKFKFNKYFYIAAGVLLFLIILKIIF
jgi:hypothetical protein